MNGFGDAGADLAQKVAKITNAVGELKFEDYEDDDASQSSKKELPPHACW